MNFKELIESRNTKVEEMQALINAAKTEQRSLTEEEIRSFDEIKAEIEKIDKTINKAEEAEKLEKREIKDNGGKDTEEEEEIRAFADYIRGEVTEQRATNLTQGDNGAVIPKTIANRIIETVKELSPIYSLATVYNVKGTLAFPVWGDNTNENVTCAYATEFTALTSHSGKFTSVELSGYLAGALTKVSKSLINNSDFDLVSFIVRKVAEAISEFLEKELIVGTANKMTGILSATAAVTTASTSAITSDEIIDLEMSIPEVFAKNACFIMNKATFAAVRKLKDTTNQYLLNRDITKDFGWELLGHPVYITESMPTIAAGAKVIAYGDMSGLYVKLADGLEIQTLNELYATEHAVGVVGWIEADSNIVEPQKIKLLKMKAS